MYNVLMVVIFYGVQVNMQKIPFPSEISCCNIFRKLLVILVLSHATTDLLMTSDVIIRIFLGC